MQDWTSKMTESGPAKEANGCKKRSQDGIKRWTAKRRAALVLSIVRGQTSVPEAARQHGLTVAEIEEWKEQFLTAAENGLKSRPLDEDALKDAEIKRLKQKVGELVHAGVNAVMDIDILKEAAKVHLTLRQTPNE